MNRSVLMINRALPQHWAGGLERHVEDLVFGLASAGWRVGLLSAPLGPSDAARYRDAGIQLHTSHASPRRYSLRYMLGIGRTIDEVLNHDSYDLIHAHEFALGTWLRPANAPPVILSVHGTITSETPLHPDVYNQLGSAQRAKAWLRYGRRFAFAPAWRRALRQSDRILLDSAFSRDELERIVPDCLDKTRLVPLAVRETTPPPNRQESLAKLGWQGTHLLTIGRLEWAKGHELALEALARLREFAWTYWIVGEGTHRAAIERAILRLGLSDRVHLAGRVSQEQKLAMLAAADLFIWPERTHPAFGLAGLESLLAGTPVIATRRGAIPEVIGARGGWLAEPSVDSFTAVLRPLLSNLELLVSARANLRAEALDRFAFERMLNSVQAVYRSVIEG